MLWNKDKAKEVTELMFKRAQEKEAVDRKSFASKQLSFYHDCQADYIAERLSEHHTDDSEISICYFNVVKRITDALSMVYLVDAKRTVVGSEQDKEIYAEIVSSTNLHLTMKMASRYTNLVRTILLRPLWRDGEMDIDLITPNICDVWIGDSPKQLEQVLITNFPPNGGKPEATTYSRWSATQWEKLDSKGFQIEQAPNPYGVLPFVPIWVSPPVHGQFWTLGGESLLSIQEAIAEMLSDYLEVVRFQGFGTAWGKLIGDQNLPAIGPRAFIQIENENGEFGYAKTNAPLLQILASIEHLAKWAAVSSGLSAQTMSVKPTQQSGLAQISSNLTLTEIRKDQQNLFAGYERNLFNLFRIIWNEHNPTRKLSDSARLQIDMMESRAVMSPDKEAILQQAEIKMGITSVIDLIQLKNPELSYDAAKIKAKQNKIDNQEFINTLEPITSNESPTSSTQTLNVERK